MKIPNALKWLCGLCLLVAVLAAAPFPNNGQIPVYAQFGYQWLSLQELVTAITPMLPAAEAKRIVSVRQEFTLSSAQSTFSVSGVGTWVTAEHVEVFVNGIGPQRKADVSVSRSGTTLTVTLLPVVQVAAGQLVTIRYPAELTATVAQDLQPGQVLSLQELGRVLQGRPPSIGAAPGYPPTSWR